MASLFLKKTKLNYTVMDLKMAGIICAFSRRLVRCAAGNRILNYDFRYIKEHIERENVLKARRDLFNYLGIPIHNAVFLEQVHKAKVYKATSENRGRGVLDFRNSLPGCDAAITNEPETALCVLTADCLPIIFWEPDKKVIGIAHAGWRGTNAGIVQKVVNKMCKTYNCFPSKIRIYIGPGIRSCCYEIGENIKLKFLSHIKRKKGRFYLDLVKVNIAQLIKSGIKKQNIFDSFLCTSCRSREFFSYRRGDKYERMLTVVMIERIATGR